LCHSTACFVSLWLSLLAGSGVIGSPGSCEKPMPPRRVEREEWNVRYVVARLKWLGCHVSYTLRLLCDPQDSVMAINNYLARIKGMPPCPNPNGIIFFACDTRFMEQFGYSLLFSCYEHARACGVHIHLYEPSDAVLQKLAALSVQFPDMRVSYTYE